MPSHDLPEPADSSLRASDTERREVLEQLEVAGFEGRLDEAELQSRIRAAQIARTRGDLRALTADLPVTHRTPARGHVVQLSTGAPIVAVFGGTDRRGRWRPARGQTALALFGGVRLDLREAEFPEEGLALRVRAVFGGVEIRVPDGMRVEMTGFSLFGGRSVSGDEGTTDAGRPVLRLHAVALFGGIDVKVGRPQVR